MTLPQRRPQDHVIGAACTTVLDLIAGPRRVATVLQAGPDAAYLDLDGTCLGVLAAGAVLVPCGVRTALPRLPALSAGDKAVVQGGGSIEVPGLEVKVTEIVDTSVPVLARAAAGRGANELRDAVGDRHAGVLAELPAKPLRQLVAFDPAAEMGLGRGLTPLGDDVLAGWLATGGREPAPDPRADPNGGRTLCAAADHHPVGDPADVRREGRVRPGGPCPPRWHGHR